MPRSRRSKIKLALVQPSLRGGSASAHELEIQKLINRLFAKTPDWIILPETFLGGPRLKSERHEYAEIYQSILHKLMLMAKQNRVHIFGSIIEKRGRRYFNTLVWIDRRGRLSGLYRKNHLFRFYQEHELYSAGCGPSLFHVDNTAVAPLICYDLRFPELMRKATFAGAKLAIICAQWPASRSEHWITLLRARAIENQIYVIAVNRIGKNHRGDSFAGQSVIISPWGDIELMLSEQQNIGVQEIDLQKTAKVRKNYPFLEDSIFTLKK